MRGPHRLDRIDGDRPCSAEKPAGLFECFEELHHVLDFLAGGVHRFELIRRHNVAPFPRLPPVAAGLAISSGCGHPGHLSTVPNSY